MIGIENLALLIANGAVSGSSVHLSPGNVAKVTGKCSKQAKMTNNQIQRRIYARQRAIAQRH